MRLGAASGMRATDRDAGGTPPEDPMTRVRIDQAISVDGDAAGPDQTPGEPLGVGGAELRRWLVAAWEETGEEPSADARAADEHARIRRAMREDRCARPAAPPGAPGHRSITHRDPPMPLQRPPAPPSPTSRAAPPEPRIARSVGIAASDEVVRSAAVVAAAAVSGSVAVAASAAVTGAVGVVASAAVAGAGGVAASTAVGGSVGVVGSAGIVGSAGVVASTLLALCRRCVRCVACVACSDCADCVGCVGCRDCRGLRFAVGRTGEHAG